jgi:hypothetical protein
MRKHRLLNWISSGGFEKFYTARVRLQAHVTLWVVIFIIQYINIGVNYSESPGATATFALRNMLGVALFFYLIIYFIIPVLFRKGRIVAGIICLTIPFFLCTILNILICKFIIANFTLNDPSTRDSVQKLAECRIFSYYFLDFTLRSSWYYLTSAAPPIALKLGLDIIKGVTRRLRVERDNLNLELSFLKSQINPHFLFNTLNNIYTLTLKGSPQASDLILHLSDMMRYTLYESDSAKVSLEKEVGFLRNYMELESVRYGKAAEINLDFNEDDVGDQEIAPLLIFPFVENAFKHGQNNTSGKCFVVVKIKVENRNIEFEIINSKKDMPELRRSVGGIGQTNSRKRLELLYPDRHLLTIENSAEQYTVKLSITTFTNLHGTEN